MKLININKKNNVDDFLELNKAIYDKCLVIGYDKEGYLRASYDGNITNQEVVFLIENVKHQILNGD